ncbi:MAG: NAD-dependent deacetylase [Dehalococcoidia bacterium]
MTDTGAVGAALDAAAELLTPARHVVALTGAGLSSESGIPTYRGSGGDWTKFGEPTIDGWDLFQRDPKAWWEAALDPESQTTEFARALEVAEPNAGHMAMATLERMGKLAHVITQNIDDLHRRAGTTQLTEIHGNRALVRCMNCGERTPMARLQIRQMPPLCEGCGGVLKNDTVMFGEPIPGEALRECYRQAAMTDAFLVVGTSAVVYPAADFPVMAARRGVPLIEINPEETALTSIADVVIRASAGEALPALAERLGRQGAGAG